MQCAPAGRHSQDGVRAGKAARVEPKVCFGRHLVAQPVILLVVAPHQHLARPHTNSASNSWAQQDALLPCHHTSPLIEELYKKRNCIKGCDVGRYEVDGQQPHRKGKDTAATDRHVHFSSGPRGPSVSEVCFLRVLSIGKTISKDKTAVSCDSGAPAVPPEW